MTRRDLFATALAAFLKPAPPKTTLLGMPIISSVDVPNNTIIMVSTRATRDTWVKPFLEERSIAVLYNLAAPDDS